MAAKKTEVTTSKVIVEASGTYFDKELGAFVALGSKIEVNAERAEVLVNGNVAKVVK